MNTLLNANALHIPLAAESVQCVITSPPYYGLRDYGVAGQIGLERTPAEYVANLVTVFREVWRVLRDDGVVWLNLGDSYANNGTGSYGSSNKSTLTTGSKNGAWAPGNTIGTTPKKNSGDAKPKDLLGIPWSVAKALQEPFYTGRIKSELDRVWLAATIDAEGTICGFTHERKDDGAIRTGVHVTITNSNMRILNEARRIWPAALSDHNRAGPGHLGKMDTWRWIAHNVNNKSLLMRELYPYLIAKKQQALLAYNLFEISKDAKRLGKSNQADEVRAKRALIVGYLSRLNHLEEVDTPDWCVEPPPLYVPGWYLRSDIIWHKPNPMPESVTDRPTKAHEYVFLLSKSATYYYDAEAIAEPGAGTEYDKTQRKSGRMNGTRYLLEGKGQAVTGNSFGIGSETRNRRTVWTIATSPYSGAHFATFPPKLVEPMILAGSRPGDIVLDPFAGTATVGRVAIQHRRRFVGLELNPAYIELAQDRTSNVEVRMF